MSKAIQLALAVAPLTIALIVGCAQPAAPHATADATDNSAPDDAEAAKPQSRLAGHDPAASDTADSPAKSAISQTPIPQPQRLILLTPRGPIIVHLHISIDGMPQQAAAESLLDDLSKAAGASDERSANWADLVASPRFAAGVAGNMPLADSAAREKAIKDFDFNRDGRVQRAELAALLAQDNARGRVFSVQRTGDYPMPDDEGASVFGLLDADQDGRISADEMSAAAVRLRSRDADDNDTVAVTDFRPPPSRSMMMRAPRYESGPERGFELRKASLESMFYTMCEFYDSGNDLQKENFELVPGLLAQLDTDSNGAVNQQEIAAILDARPDVILRVNFHAATSDRGAAEIAIESLGEDLTAAGIRTSTTRSGGVSLDLPGCRVDFSPLDMAARIDRLAAAGAQFAALDADKNEMLDSDEWAKFGPAAGLSLESLDKDADGKLSLEEFKAALAMQPSYRELQVQARVGQADDRLFSWLDAQPDGQLTSRELLGARDRLAALDANGDGAITPAEIPDRLTCSIVRSAPTAEVMPGGPMVERREINAQGPPWLAAMDRNGDGEISRREFLGTGRQFAEIDLNGDGFLDAAEAQNVSAGPGDQNPGSPDAK